MYNVQLSAPHMHTLLYIERAVLQSTDRKYQFHAHFEGWHSCDTQPITSTDTIPYLDNDPISETQYSLINFN